MTTVSSTLKIFDSMSRPMQNITQSMNLMISAMERMQNSANRNVKIDQTLVSAKRQLASAEAEITRNINQANQAQERFNQTSKSGTSSMINGLKGLAAAYISVQAAKKGMGVSDDYVSTQARLGLINDGTQTTAQLQDKIFASADRSRGIYSTMASSVGKMGLLAEDAFSNNNEVIKFTELMQKTFKVGGSSTMEQQAGMYQLTQAMAAGKLQGDEFRSIMENAPMLANAIAKFTGKSKGELKQMSADGTITADIIKGALFQAADDINSKFASLPMTFSDIFNKISNRAIKSFSPVIEKVNKFLNSPSGAAFVEGLSNNINAVAIAANGLVSALIWINNIIQNNWPMIEPIIWGIVAALVVYNAVSVVTNGIIAAQAFAEASRAAASAMATGATFAATAAQYGLNAALYACPVTWIILAIIALIAIFYVAVGAINHFAGTSISATGIIIGVFAVLGASVYNIVASMWNYFASFAEFFANVFNEPVYSVNRLFVNLANTVLDIVKTIASAIDAVFGSSLSGSIQSIQGQMQNWLGEMPEGYKVIQRMELKSLDGAFNTGYKFGNGIADKFDLSRIAGSNSAAANNLDNISSIGKVGEVGKINDKVDISSEDLKAMRELAEMKNIQNFVTLTPTVQVTTGDVHKEADIDTLVAKIERRLEEEIASSTAAVYA